MYRRSSYNSGSSSLPLWIYAVFFITLIVLSQLIAHSISEDSAIRAAEGSGYTDVEVTERHTFFVGLQGCSKGDLVMFDVTGTDARGTKRTFVVCDGLFKAATVRFK